MAYSGTKTWQEATESVDREYGIQISALIGYLRNLPNADPLMKLYSLLSHKTVPIGLIQEYNDLLSYNEDCKSDRKYFQQRIKEMKSPIDKRRLELRSKGLDEVIRNVENQIKRKEEQLALFYKDILTQIVGKHTPRTDVKELLAMAGAGSEHEQ